MLFPTIVAIATTIIMLMVAFVWRPTRKNWMQRRFTHHGGMSLPTASSVPSSTTEDGRKVVSHDIVGIELASPERGAGGGGGEMQQQSEEGEEQRVPSDDERFFHADTLMLAQKTRVAKCVVFLTVLFLLSISNFIGAELWAVSLISALVMLIVDLLVVYKDHQSSVALLSFLRRVYQRMPWTIAPFVLCMFLLVRVLTDTGFTGRFASWMIAGEYYGARDY